MGSDCPAGAGATGESFLAALFQAFSIVSSILSIGDDVSSVFFATVARAVPSCSIMVDMATCVAVSSFAPLILRGRARKVSFNLALEIERTVLQIRLAVDVVVSSVIVGLKQ